MPDRRQLELSILALDTQRAVLGDAVVDSSIAILREKLAALNQSVITKTEQAGERKLVTVMFADISGFTALSERLDPEQVRALVNACFSWLVPIIEKYGGVVEKFIGDEIMAMFGAPVAHENDAERALRASLEMMDALVEFNKKHLTSLGMHFGINTGIVVAGGLGSDGRQQYGVMGDAVNVAARLEDISETGQIIVGPSTHRLTASLFRFDMLPPVRVKGKSEPIPIYRLIGVKSDARHCGLTFTTRGTLVRVGCGYQYSHQPSVWKGKHLVYFGRGGFRQKPACVRSARRDQ
jgi:class 3 adenylate cyclase